jgi:hypothetical protein
LGPIRIFFQKALLALLSLEQTERVHITTPLGIGCPSKHLYPKTPLMAPITPTQDLRGRLRGLPTTPLASTLIDGRRRRRNVDVGGQQPCREGQPHLASCPESVLGGEIKPFLVGAMVPKLSPLSLDLNFYRQPQGLSPGHTHGLRHGERARLTYLSSFYPPLVGGECSGQLAGTHFPYPQRAVQPAQPPVPSPQHFSIRFRETRDSIISSYKAARTGPITPSAPVSTSAAHALALTAIHPFPPTLGESFPASSTLL